MYSNAKIDNRVNLLSLIGPASVILPVLLLIIKESPFFIDIAATSFVCLLICSQFHLKGLGIASLLLLGVMLYDFTLGGTPITFWEFGLGVSLQLAFIITALASVELKEAFHSACKAASAAAMLELEEWKNKISEALEGKESLSSEIEELKAKLLPLQDRVKDKTERMEMFERLLGMARAELVEQTAKRHHFEEQYLTFKHALGRIQEDVEEEKNGLCALELKLEAELQKAHALLHEKEELSHQQAKALIDKKLELEALHERVAEAEVKLKESLHVLESQKGMTNEAEEKVQALGEQLEVLIDRLKHLQTEKEDLAKALGEALNEEQSELQKVRATLHEKEAFSQQQAKDLIDGKGEIETLHEKLKESLQIFEIQKRITNEAEEKIQVLEKQQEEGIDRLKNLQMEKEALAKALDEALNEEQIGKESKELKRVWGLHDQLRSQFEEKSRLLDQTRRELFHAQEELVLFQKNYADDQEEMYQVFEDHILTLEQEILDLEINSSPQ